MACRLKSKLRVWPRSRLLSSSTLKPCPLHYVMQIDLLLHWKHFPSHFPFDPPPLPPKQKPVSVVVATLKGKEQCKQSLRQFNVFHVLREPSLVDFDLSHSQCSQFSTSWREIWQKWPKSWFKDSVTSIAGKKISSTPDLTSNYFSMRALRLKLHS